MSGRGFTFALTDFYCGAGGSSTGAVMAGAEVRNAANHWQRALETHQRNHPHTRHYMADLLEADPRQFSYTPIAWFSPECTTHSRGRGKSVLKPMEQLHLWEPRDPDEERSRVTMEQRVAIEAAARMLAEIEKEEWDHLSNVRVLCWGER